MACRFPAHVVSLLLFENLFVLCSSPSADPAVYRRAVFNAADLLREFARGRKWMA
jgi:hypothetical protein